MNGIKQLVQRKASLPIRYWVSIFFFFLMVFFWGNSAQIYAKAFLAKILVAQAWQRTLDTQQNQKPWTWSDTWPVAKLYFPRVNKTRYVLAGTHGSSLAFGPGIVDNTVTPEMRGTKVIGGHRDTHFAFLDDLQVGDIFLLQNKLGHWQYYQLDETHIVDTRAEAWSIDPDLDSIHLVTCFPFDSAVPGGPLRFIAIGTPMFNKSFAKQSALGGTNLYQPST